MAAAVEYVTGVDGKELTMTGPVSAFVPGLAQNLHPKRTWTQARVFRFMWGYLSPYHPRI